MTDIDTDEIEEIEAIIAGQRDPNSPWGERLFVIIHTDRIKWLIKKVRELQAHITVADEMRLGLVARVKELQAEVRLSKSSIMSEFDRADRAEANAKSTQISLDWWIADNMKIIAERKEMEARVKELEVELEECKKEIQFHTLNNNHWTEQNRKLEADLKSAEEGLIRCSNPDNPWMGIHAECKGWMDRARRAEADLAKEKEDHIQTKGYLDSSRQAANQYSLLYVEEKKRVGELEEGIRKHKKLNVCWNPEREKHISTASTVDIDLYKLIEEGRK